MHTLSKLFLLIFIFFLTSACSTAATSTTTVANTETSTVNDDLSEGEILKVDTTQAKFMIKHGNLKNIGMPGMTMIFKLKDMSWLNQYKAGDKIHFRAEIVNGALTVTRIELAN